MQYQLLSLLIVLTVYAASLGAANVHGMCTPQDLKGLTGFKAGIRLDTSGRLEKWVGLKCCEWEGISCDNATGRVTEIRLPGFISTSDYVYQSEIRGWLSPSITLLSSLEVIDLGGLMNLAGTIPPSIGFCLQKLRKVYLYGNQISGLVHLDLHNNSFIGAIPEKIGQLHNMKELDLSNNFLGGRIPLSITNLTAISVLYLDTNNLEGEILSPSRLDQMPSLSFLRLHNNQLTGEISPNFANLISLQRVSLAHNRLKGSIPSSLGALSALTELYLDDNHLSGIIPESMGKLSQLLILSISNNMIRGPLPQEMSSLFNLQIINLSFNQFNFSSIPQWLLRLPSLSQIYMAGCGIQGEIPESLKIMPSPIQELDLSGNHLTGNLPSWLGTLTQLYLLNLSRNSLVADVPESITKLNALGVLDLHSNKLTGNVGQVFKMEQRFPQGPLTYIDLSDNRFTEGIEQIGIGAECGVQSLNLSCNFLSGRLPTTIKMCSSLKSLDLSKNNLGFNLPDALANLSSLEVLKLQRNRFTGSIPEGFLKLSKLRDLNLSNNLLVGQIPAGKPLANFPGSSFSGNTGLCGKPLNPCKR
ncbi:LRR receptor-like serine/threonine-protein kinase FLS2 isoform X2 [Eucalyptus grandis]|uniref:LRR receptor-like serine/threonine-protein kinase FLS2 isoform X2 n=1 Tax=Eucalyptus grandis TaxID=71139 RepID=UPI00192ED28C|nr:LRR receptor-like serine/threonine-protein kinase FLS2 isoform X2 [Eucalyptus grandis]